MQLIGFFDRGAALWPDRNCFVDEHGQRRYRDVRTASHRTANAIRAEGLGVESHCAVLGPNGAQTFEAVLGLLRAGATWLPVNGRGTTAEMLEFLSAHDCELLFFHSEFSAVAAAFAAGAPARRLVCLDRDLDLAPSLARWSATQPERAPDVPMESGRVAVIKATGGTTGQAKSVMQTHGNFETMAASFLACMPFDEPPVHLVAAPITHGAGSICFPLFASGATHVILSKADPRTILGAIEQYRVNVLFLPPTVIYMMLAHPELREYDYSSLKYFIYAAAPMSADKLQLAMEVFGPMAQTYGQAEAPMLCTYLGPREHRTNGATGAARLLSCGRPTPFTELAIMDDAGRLLADGERGEIVVRGGLVFKGYHRNHEATEDVSQHGWHHTGDIGWRDAEGYIYIVDRKKDMIITGGFNVFPSEVEQVLWSHVAVQDCAVIGVPDEKWGEAVKAIVELRPGAEVQCAELLELCRRELGGVKAPKTVEIWPELPRSPVGKVLKKDIRKTFWKAGERAI